MVSAQLNVKKKALAFELHTLLTSKVYMESGTDYSFETELLYGRPAGNTECIDNRFKSDVVVMKKKCEDQKNYNMAFKEKNPICFKWLEEFFQFKGENFKEPNSIATLLKEKDNAVATPLSGAPKQ